MLWDLYQQHQISQTQTQAGEATRRAQAVGRKIEEVEDKIDSLALACQAMWEVLSETLSDPDAALRNKMLEIDARDGKVDGKMRRVLKNCPHCERPLHSRHRRCMYCGKATQAENFLQT